MASKDEQNKGKLHIETDWKTQAREEKQRSAEEARGGQGQPGEDKKLSVDDDWKAQARAEKQRLAEQAAAGDEEGAAQPGRGQMPEANFQTLVSTMVTQALFAMGAIPDPQTGQRMAHLDLARHHIDMLGVLQEKTKGNLEDEDAKLLEQAVHELRMQYLHLSKALQEQQQKGGGMGAGPAGDPGAAGGQGPIVG